MVPTPRFLLPLLPSPTEHIGTWRDEDRAEVLSHIPVYLVNISAEILAHFYIVQPNASSKLNQEEHI